MDSSGGNPEVYQNGRRYGMQFTPGSLPSPLSALVELSRILRGRHQHAEIDSNGSFPSRRLRVHSENDQSLNERAEVSIRIIEADESDSLQFSSGQDSLQFSSGHVVSLLRDAEDRNAQTSHVQIHDLVRSVGADSNSATGLHSSTADDTESSNVGGRGAVSHRYDFQQLTRWIEQVLPFIILLLMVFIRQHVQGFFVTFWISAVIVKANDLLRKQTALKGDRKIIVLLALSGVLLTHILVVYCLYKGEDILRPLILVPPKYIPKFWQAIFIIILNDTMVRQMAMIAKCLILIRFKNSRGRPYRQQGRLLTVVEYMLLLYRALLPAPVWYRFFLNKDYGSLFSSLMTGLYLTFKLTATIEKVQRCFAAIKLLFRREVQYGSAATLEEVLAAGDLCAICQEKMHAPISLRCKHIFCEDCVSEWFERERTCPLCRAVVKSSSLKSFGDGSTSLFFQIF